MRKISKANTKKLIEEVTALMVSLNATKTAPPIPSFKTWRLNTKGGPLDIKLPLEQSVIYTVFAQFTNVTMAKTVNFWNDRLNHHSGKFNFHCKTIECIMQSLKDELTFLKV